MDRYWHLNLQDLAKQAMEEYGFLWQFPSAVTTEAYRVEPNGWAYLAKGSIKDMRDVLWSSIDNHDTRDFDQLEFCERRPNREVRVLVAIADVDHYVAKSSRIDKHAAHNGTTVYTGVVIFPMLPERLSSDISSLKPGEDRMAVVVEFFVRKDGSTRPGEIFQALVKNHAKLVYEPIGEWLEGQSPVPEEVMRIPGLKDQILLQHEAAQRLNTFRMHKGALELETIEASPVMKDGTIVDLVVKKKNPARYIIENFMVAANGVMVKFLEKHNCPYIQRVVRRPEKWFRIRDIALELGGDLPPEPDPLALSEFLSAQHRRDPERFPDLSLTIVKLLGPGEYVISQPGNNKIGHFGLAVQDYTHSTAPNRRYVDIIIQRLIKSVLEEKSAPYTRRELSEIAEWCTTRDKASKKVERFMRKVVGAVLLRNRIGEAFDAIVTGSSEKGVYVRLLAPPVEGRVILGYAGMDIGQKARVRLVSLDPEKGYIDFERVKR